MKNLLIIGAGQFGMIAKEIAESTARFDEIAFLDDNNRIAVGRLCDHISLSNKFDCAVIAIGSAETRLELIDKLENAGYEIITLIHNKAYVSRSAKVGKGSIIEPMAVIHADVSVGTGCIISAGAVLNHNSTIEEGCHIDCGTIVGARALVKARTKTQYGAILTEKA